MLIRAGFFVCLMAVLLGNPLKGSNDTAVEEGNCQIRSWKNYFEKKLLEQGGRIRVADDEACEAMIPDSTSKTASSVQIWRETNLSPGKFYEMTFDAEVKRPEKIKVVYNMEFAPYKYHAGEMWFSLKEGTNHLAKEFRVNSDKGADPAVVRFFLGSINGSIKISGMKINEIKRKKMFGDYQPPYAELKQSNADEHSYGKIDFWKTDRLNVPHYNECRNLLSNPSFEQGLRYYIFPPDIGTYEPGYEDKYSIDGKVSHFGKSSLKIKAIGPQNGFDLLQSFAYPVNPGKSYTLSFYARANKAGIRLRIDNISSHAFAKEQQVENSDSVFTPTESWERYVARLKFHATGYGFAMKVLDSVADGAVWIDGIQLEEGETVTDFTEKPISTILVTSAAGNFLTSEQKIDGKLILQTTRLSQKGTVSVSVKDFFYNETALGVFDFTTDKEGRAEVKLALDNFAAKQRGVFVVRAEMVLAEEKHVDYLRFSIMDKMQGLHRNKDIFSYHQLVIPKYEEGLKRWKDIGLGATNYFFYNFNNEILFQLLKKYNIDDTCALLRQHWDSSLRKLGIVRGTGNTISIERAGAGDPNPETLVQGMREWTSVTPGQEKAVQEAAKKYAQYYHWRKNFAFDMEMANGMLTKGNYDDFSKILLACAKGVKEASGDNQVYLEGGASNIIGGISLTDNLLTSCEKNAPKFKFDRFAVHAYGHPENEDLDDLLRRYLKVLDRHGYSNAPLYINEAGYFAPYCIIDWGLTPYRPYLMDHYHIWSISYDMGWGERISAALTARAWLLALKYQDRVKQYNVWRPFIYLDCDLTPMAAQKVANTMARLLGNAAFKEEIVFAAKSKAYVFETDDKIPIAVIWNYENSVETGLRPPPVMEIRSDGNIVEILDLMENSMTVLDNQKVIHLPLTPFPVFLKGKKGGLADLSKIVREISVKGDKYSPVQVNLKIKDKNSLELKVKNLLTREFKGELAVNGEKIGDLSLSSSEEYTHYLPLKKSVIESQINLYNEPWTINSSEGSTYSENFCFVEAFSVKKAVKPISMTGNLADWDGIPYVPIKNLKLPSGIVEKDFNVGKENSQGNEKEFKAKFKATWDENYFYLLVDVTDDKLFYGFGETKDSLINRNDALLVYFDTLCNGKEKNTVRVDSDDYYYVLMPRPDEGKALAFVDEACNQQLGLGVDAVKPNTYVSEIKTVFKRTQNGYFYEVAFPQWTLLPLYLKEGYAFGFGLYVNDRDGEKDKGRGLSLSHPPGSSCWRRADLWPEIILEK